MAATVCTTSRTYCLRITFADVLMLLHAGKKLRKIRHPHVQLHESRASGSCLHLQGLPLAGRVFSAGAQVVASNSPGHSGTLRRTCVPHL